MNVLTEKGLAKVRKAIRAKIKEAGEQFEVNYSAGLQEALNILNAQVREDGRAK